MLLRALTESTGILHDAQVLQLKMYPLFYIEHARSAEVHVNLEDKEVDFYVKVKGKEPANFDAKCEELNKAVKWLLGPAWLVRVRIREKVVYRGLRGADK